MSQEFRLDPINLRIVNSHRKPQTHYSAITRQSMKKTGTGIVTLYANLGEEDRRMAKHIGIVACSAEGAALCYRTICSEAPREMGEHCHPEITMHTHPLSEYMVHIRADDWEKVAQLMLSSARKLARADADFAVCPDNTIHQAFEFVIGNSPIPWLHIAEAVARESGQKGFARLGILGTKYLMTGPVYPRTLEPLGINGIIPEEEDRERIDTIIFKELVNGIFPEKSRLYFNEVIQKLKNQGCDAVVLACTEIPLIVDPNDCPLPTLDSTRLLARAAIRKALGEAR
jgi:aspartate racemase